MQQDLAVDVFELFVNVPVKQQAIKMLCSEKCSLIQILL